MVEVSTEAIASLAQYYDQPLRCFTFGDFQLSPMVEEFEEILGDRWKSPKVKHLID